MQGLVHIQTRVCIPSITAVIDSYITKMYSSISLNIALQLFGDGEMQKSIQWLMKTE